MLNCFLCNKNNQTRKVSENTSFGAVIPVFYCNSCQVYFLGGGLDEEFLRKFYEEEYFPDASNAKLFYMLKTWQMSLRAESQRQFVEKNISSASGNNILEVGACDGTSLNVYRNAGWHINGIEISNSMVARASEIYDIELSRELLTEMSTRNVEYDIVAFPHSLEHMPDVEKVLDATKKVLAPNGAVFIELPFSPEPDEISSSELNEYCSTTHLYDFRIDSIRKLLKNAGFKNILVERYYYGLPEWWGKWRFEAATAIMKGTPKGLGITGTMFLICASLIFLSKGLFKKNIMVEVPIERQWCGLGDNIRVMAYAN